MPVLNGLPYLPAALESLSAQVRGEIEIIAVDNGSTDGSLEFLELRARTQQGLRLISQPKRGIANARNAGLEQAAGSFIAFLDQDDICPAGTIARHRSLLIQTPPVDAVFGLTLVTSDITEANLPAVDLAGRLKLTMMLSAALFRARVFERLGLFDPHYALADDFDFLLRLMEADLPVLLDQRLATVHRRHPAQATADLAATRQDCTKALMNSMRRRRKAGNISPLKHPLATVVPR